MADEPDTGQQDGQPPGEQRPGIEQRFERIEQEQTEQRGMLEKVLAAVTTGKTGTAGSVQHSADGGSGGDIAAQVRRGVEQIEAEKKRKADEQAAADADKSWRESIEARLPEQRPAEPDTGIRSRVQRWLVGKPDPR